MNPALETLILALAPEHGLTLSLETLFIGAEPHPNIPPETIGWQPLKPKATAWENAGFNRIDELETKIWPLILILPGKSRDETLTWFATARKHLAPNGTIVVAMANTAGAGRFEKQFEKATGKVTSIQKNKCRAFFATQDNNWDETLFEQWHALGTPSPIGDSKFITQAGIFSNDHIDPGSQLLADHFPKNIRGNIADLGAGWGFLSDSALQSNPNINRINLFEADSRALDCARKNLASHSTEIHFHWHDVIQGLPDTYDAIIMNPPFHSGQSTDVDLGKAFITTAVQSLRRGGRLFIVANRQLPYETLLDSLKLRWQKPAETPIYKLLFASKP